MNTFSIRLLRKLRLLGSLNVSGKLVLNNQKFSIPVLRETGMDNLFMSEPWMIDVLKILLKFEHTGFVDVGVNLGQTLLKFKSVSANIPYLGFEPNPLCVHYLHELIRTNQFERCTIVAVGISTQTGLAELHFFSASGTDSSATIIPDFRQKESILRKEYVPVFNLSEIEQKINLSAFSILKIDVEGAELEVLKSFADAIRKNRPFILVEILPVYHAENGQRLQRQNEILDLLAQLQYTIFRVKKANDSFIGLEEIAAIGIHADPNNCEYVMVPSEKKEAFTGYAGNHS